MKAIKTGVRIYGYFLLKYPFIHSFRVFTFHFIDILMLISGIMLVGSHCLPNILSPTFPKGALLFLSIVNGFGTVTGSTP